jgi:hypothetical protein
MPVTNIPLVDNLLNKGEIPAVRVEIEQKSIVQLVIAVILSAIAIMMLHKTFYKK